MTIGLYDIMKNKETPMSKITQTIKKYLIGQQSPIINILFIIDDTLLSTSKNGSIFVWETQNQELKYKIKENINKSKN